MSLSFIPLGVGDAFTSRYFSSSLAVMAEGSLLLVDCPHPIQRMMRDASERAGVPLAADRIHGVVLTHLHADHSSGLEGLAYWFHFVLRRKLPLIVHPKVSARLWAEHLAAGMDSLASREGGPPVGRTLEDYFELVPLRDDRPIRHGPFAIECRRTLHHIPTTALRISAGGRTLGHSADTSYDPSLIDWLAEADLFVHETNHGIHTPYERLAELPEAVRRKMRLNHYADDFDLAASVIEPLREGVLYTV